MNMTSRMDRPMSNVNMKIERAYSNSYLMTISFFAPSGTVYETFSQLVDVQMDGLTAMEMGMAASKIYCCIADFSCI